MYMTCHMCIVSDEGLVSSWYHRHSSRKSFETGYMLV
jgi:hypothetical protein